MATYPRVPTQNNQQYTLDTQLAQAGTSLTLNQSVAGIVQAPGYCVVDRVDSSGSVTATKREYIYFTGVTGAQLTGLTRGQAGSSDQVHSVGAVVEFVPNVSDENDKYTVFTAEHSVTGAHSSLASISYLRVINRFDASGASVTLSDIVIPNSANASGASLQGLLATIPVWVLTGNASAATTSLGKPIDMPRSGTLNWASVVLRSPVSGTSLVLDINKNFTSIFTDQNTRLSILGGGTYASTASISVKNFVSGDIFTVDLDNGGNYADATVKIHAR